MEDYIKKLDSLEAIKNEVFAIYNVNSYGELAKCLSLDKTTTWRMLSEVRNGNYTGPEIKNAEKLVKVLADYNQIDANLLRKQMYKSLYAPFCWEERLQEAKFFWEENEANRELLGNTVEDVEHLENIEKNISKEDCSDSLSEERNILIERIADVIRKIAKDCNLNIENYIISKKSEAGIIFHVSPEYNSVFMEAYIGMIYGIYLTEENYNSTIHDVAELNTEDGIIILFYEDENVFDKAWRDEKLKVENNVLLYCLSEERKICVKSTRKQQKKFLKDLFGKERLLF